MNGENKKLVALAVEKINLFVWIFSVPLIPMIIAEMTMELPANIDAAFKSYYLILWFAFTLEFAVKFFTAKDRLEYLKRNPLDLLVILTPALRVFKIFRVLRFPIVLLSDRVLHIIGRVGLSLVYYAIFVVIILLASADLVFYFEKQNPLSDIQTFNEALWWAVNYLTTTGSSDYIATTGGKAVGLVLMTVGFSIFSIIIASLVSFFMKEYSKTAPEDSLLEGIKDQLGIDEVMERLERIEKKLDGK